jgi:hypothetical protein
MSTRKAAGDVTRATVPGRVPQPQRSAPATRWGGMSALQRSAGNAAVVQMLRGSGYPSGPESLLEPSSGTDAETDVKAVVSRNGSPLDRAKRQKAEAVFQEDFSDVRLHTDVVAQRSAAGIGARAYTVGNDIVSGTGGIDDRTLFHELTHVSQQRKGPVAGTDRGDGVRMSDPRDPFEQVAAANERLADGAGAPQHDAGHGPAHHEHGAAVQRAAAGPETVQRSTEGDQEEAAGGHPAVRRRVLVVCDESGLGLGGVPVFNMEMVKGLQQDHDVTLLTVDKHEDYDHGKTTRQHGGARIVNVTVPDVDEGRDRLNIVALGSPGEHGLPDKSDAFDIVVGHSRFSGPAAQKIRDDWYPEARVVHFLHTSPVRLDKIKDQPDKGIKKATTERELMHKADLVAGVGSLLTKEAERLSEQVLRIPALHEFVPGTEVEEPVEPSMLNQAKYRLRLPRKLKLLLPGRATDEIKGVEAAVSAIGILRRPRAKGGQGLDVRLTIRGGPDPAKHPEEHARWKSIIEAHGEGGVTMLPFTSDAAELANDREHTHAVIMPSLHEGFGLVATEAAGRSLPVLVNGESGAAQFLDQVSRQGAGMTVDAPFQMDAATGREVAGGADQRAQAWASAIATLRKRLPAARGDAEELHGILKNYTWRHAAQALVAATMATPEPDGRARTHPEEHSNHGAITRQGPAGSVEHVSDRQDWQPHDFWDGSSPQPTKGRSTEEQQLARLAELGAVLGLRGVPGTPVKREPVKRSATM